MIIRTILLLLLLPSTTPQPPPPPSPYLSTLSHLNKYRSMLPARDPPRVSVYVSVPGAESVKDWWVKQRRRKGYEIFRDSNDDDVENERHGFDYNGVLGEDYFKPIVMPSTVVMIAVYAGEPGPGRDDNGEFKICVLKGLIDPKVLDCFVDEVDGRGKDYSVNLGPEAGGYYVVTASEMVETAATDGKFREAGADFIVEPGNVVDGIDLCDAKGNHESLDFDVEISRSDIIDDAGVNSTSASGRRMPVGLCHGYTVNGTIPARLWYYDDKTDKVQSYKKRGREEIERMRDRVRNRETFYYGKTDTWLYDSLSVHSISGKKVLIIGSNVPWYESVCHVYGGDCVTLEYNELEYHGCETYNPSEFLVEYGDVVGVGEDGEEVRDVVEKFDVIWSISSFEHDGLGRYGDELNPDADLEAMSKSRRMLKDDGLMWLAVPVGKDVVRWNEGRVYGDVRLKMLLDGWDVVGAWGYEEGDLRRDIDDWREAQPVFVIKKSA